MLIYVGGEPFTNRPTAQCPARLVLDLDSIGCTHDAGHAGPHRDHGEDGEFVWVTAETFDAAADVPEEGADHG